MVKVEQYKRVYEAFKVICAEGRLSVSFSVFYCENDVNPSQMHSVLKSEFSGLQSLPGYKRRRRKNAASYYSEVYEKFKKLCAT